MPVDEALNQLRYSVKLRSAPVMKMLHNAVLKAEEYHGLKRSDLIVAVAETGKGSYEKRLNFHARGRSGIRTVKQSHLTLVLREKDPFATRKRDLKQIKWQRHQDRLHQDRMIEELGY